MACITCPSHGPSFADGLTGGSFFLTSRHSTNRSEGGERASISPKSYTDRPKTRCVKCTPMCASARVAPSNIVYQRYGYRSTGTGVLTTKVLLLR